MLNKVGSDKQLTKSSGSENSSERSNSPVNAQGELINEIAAKILADRRPLGLSELTDLRELIPPHVQDNLSDVPFMECTIL